MCVSDFWQRKITLKILSFFLGHPVERVFSFGWLKFHIQIVLNIIYNFLSRSEVARSATSVAYLHESKI